MILQKRIEYRGPKAEKHWRKQSKLGISGITTEDNGDDRKQPATHRKNPVISGKTRVHTETHGYNTETHAHTRVHTETHRYNTKKHGHHLKHKVAQ